MKPTRRFQRFNKKPWSKQEYDNWKTLITHNQTNMSIWENEELQDTETNSDSMFLNKALGDGDSIKLTFVNIQHEDQREETPEEYKSEDGKEWVLYFTDEAGKERKMTQKSLKGKLIQSLRAGDVQVDQKITVKRTGVGIETEYAVTKGWEGTTSSPEGTPEVKEDEIPF